MKLATPYWADGLILAASATLDSASGDQLTVERRRQGNLNSAAFPPGGEPEELNECIIDSRLDQGARVAIISPTADVRHAALYVAAARVNTNVRILVPDSPLIEQWPGDVTPWPLSSKGRRNTSQWMTGLPRAVKGFEPQLIHIHNEPWAVTCQRLLRSNLPVVIHGAESVLGDAPLPQRIRRVGTRGALRRAAGYLNWGQTGLRAAEEAGLPAETPRAAIPASPPDPQSFLGPPFGDLRVNWRSLFVGRLLPVKGVETLLRSLAEAGRSARMIVKIVGSGPEGARLRGLAQSLGVDAHFLGHLDEAAVQRAMAGAHVLVVPSVDTTTAIEQWGRVVVEGMMTGRAVLVSDSGELPHIVGNRDWVFRQGDARSLGTSLDSLLQNPSLLHSRSEQAYLRSQHFHPSVLAQSLLEFWDEVLRCSAGRGPA